MSFIARIRWACLAGAAACAVAGAPGCANKMGQNLRGPGYTDETAKWGAGLRPQGNPRERVGFATKAQQIERNLGF